MTMRAMLHATWLKTFGEPALHVWGELVPLEGPDDKSVRTRRTTRQPAPVEPVLHPRSLAVAALRRVLASLPRRGAAPEGLATAAAVHVLLPFPTALGVPISEHEARHHPCLEDTPPVPWWVTSLRLPPALAVPVLSAVGGTPAHGEFLPPAENGEDSEEPLRVALGQDFRTWMAASHWTWALLARQRMVPTLDAAPPPPSPPTRNGRRRPTPDPIPGEPARCRWLPVLDAPEDQRLLAILCDALPAAARAGRQQPLPEDEAPIIPTARVALTQFVSLAVERLVPRLLQEHEVPLGHVPTSWPEEAASWAASLASGQAEVSGPPGALHRFSTELARWSQDIGTGPQEDGFRTCFRLVPPGPGPDLGPAESSSTATEPRPDEVSRSPGRRRSPRARQQAPAGPAWTVEFLQQALADPSILVPAEEIWQGSASQERLLRDLGRASRVFPGLAKALQAARPTGCRLAPAETVLFLREVGWLLQESGFGVLLPSRMAVGHDALRLHLRVQSGTSPQEMQAARGRLGLDSLVDYQWEASLGDATLTEQEFRALAALKTSLVQVRGQWVLLDLDGVDRVLRAWDQESAHPTLGSALRLSSGLELAGMPPVEVTFEGALAGLAGEGHLEPLPTPEDFHGELRPYQSRGLSWLCFLADRGLGACLADDMGLGKTIQLIAMLLVRRASKPTLLVCPTSLLGNWQREVARFAPHLRVLVHHGPDRASGEGLAAIAADHDLVLTSYGLALRDQETLEQVAWDGLVLDEAQAIKNPTTRQSRAVRSIPAAFRVAMTGTPVENRLTDLWSIMEFLNAGLLDSQERFRSRFVLPVEQYGNQARAEELRRTVQPFILRRLKSDPSIIQDLPDKIEMKVYCPLTREQATLYQATVDEMLRKIEDSADMARRGLILSTMMRLKQICNHPAQFLGDGSELSRRSGKLSRLEEMLEELLEAGERALVFTQFTEMGTRLRRHLEDRFATEVLFLSGETPRKQRDRMVEAFQSEAGPRVFILSLKAGGVGLNLTQASHVFHYDRWWNPAVENQATDRAYRIGQARNVQVHKYICQGTLEESIDALIEGKVALAESVVGTGESWLTELGNAQLRELLSLRQDAVEED